MNRSAINQALSKSLAYKAAGKQDAANYWAGVLVQLLATEGIVPDSAATAARYRKPKTQSSAFNSYFNS